MPILDYQTLMLPVLRLAADGETRVPDVEARLASEYGLTADERGRTFPSGGRVLQNRTYWAKFYLAKAGLLDMPRRGRFVASETGRALLAEKPERIDVERLLTYPAFAAFYRSPRASGATLAVDEAVPKPALGTTCRFRRSRPGIPISSRPASQHEAGHRSEMKPATLIRQ